MTSIPSVPENPVLHVVVVGFHHKKGSQVEYSYPPLILGGEVDSHEAPPEWKNLPSLAIPDGAHNYIKDTIYFHLPALEGSHRTVYGVACYRQIDSKDLKNRTVDITRSTVQKSVCVLSYLPLYGLIQAKLEMITHAYFRELDFSKVSLLEDTYKNLSLSLTESLLDVGSQVFLGMSCKDVVLLFKHKIVLLFKLILLERRVLFTGTPVQTLSNVILSVLSLFPGMIERGLVEAASYGIHKHISPNMKSTKVDEEVEDFMEIRYSEDRSPELSIDCDTYMCNNIEAPESPTMERGDRTEDLDRTRNPATPGNVQSTCDTNLSRTNSLGRYADSKSKKAKENTNKILRQSISLPFDEDHYSERQRKSSDNSAVLRTSSFHHPTVESHDSDKSHDFDDGSYDRQVLLVDSGPMLIGVTQLESVQTGKCIPNTDSVINIEALSQSVDDDIDLDMDYFSHPLAIGPVTGDGSISRDDEVIEGTIGRTESVEDLDSPESISQIDREDCFSWEEDRLLLAIDTDKNAQVVDDTVGLASSFKETSILERNIHSLKMEKKDSYEIRDVSREPAAENEIAVDGAGTSSTTEETVEESRSPTSRGVPQSPGMKAAAIKHRLSSAFSGLNIKQKLKKSGSQSSSEPPSPAIDALELPNLPVINQDDLGFPLAIFTKGSVCHPYLSLQFFDMMNDVNVRSFVIGATNILFRQKRHLTDIVVDVNEAKIDLHDRELQRQLTLTTADLRFADILVKGVMEQTDDLYMDGTEWEGGDEWLRAQFRLYIESMLATVVLDDPKLLEDFGLVFIQTWKTTHNYRVWASSTHPGIDNIQTGHPCQGNLGVNDIRVRLAHTMQSTERGKKINAAVTQTGKYVVQTGKAVGGALTQAKSSLSSWFSTLTNEWKGSDRSQGSTQPTVHKPTHSKNTNK